MTLDNINSNVEKLYEGKERPKSRLISPNKDRKLVEILNARKRQINTNPDIVSITDGNNVSAI